MSDPHLLVADEESSTVLGPDLRSLRRPIAAELGASLYIPATHPDLPELLAGSRIPGLRSLIVCTEDSVSESDLESALDRLRQALRRMAPSPIRRFLRPRTPGILRLIKAYEGFDLFDGVVLPKVTVSSLAAYVKALEDQPGLPILPILETEHVFSFGKLEEIAFALAGVPNPVIVVRIGGNDILNLLGMRRPSGLTAYETPLRDVIVRILSVFRPRGYAVAAPVYEHFRDLETLKRESRLDVFHGLVTKSAVHPSQISVIEDAYLPSAIDWIEAREILAVDSPGVFSLHGSMCEPATHYRWAEDIIARARIFGVREQPVGETSYGSGGRLEETNIRVL